MRTGQRGLDLIKHFESCRLEAYLDSAHVWTIGWGHTGPEVRSGMTVTQEEADMLLINDLRAAERAVDSLRIPLTQSAFDALVSFTFNLGPGWTKQSGLLDALKSRAWAHVPRELTRWVHAAGEPLKGLARRRAAEAVLFLED